MAKKRRARPRLSSERALEEIYAEIPEIPDCSGGCAVACGPIAMFKGEWERVKRSKGHTPKLAPGSLTCPMLSPTGRCTVYTVRPFICRLWGTTQTLKCHLGCEPTRWLSTAEARDIFQRICDIAGPQVTGPLGNIDDLWDGIALEAREARAAQIERIKEARRERSEA